MQQVTPSGPAPTGPVQPTGGAGKTPTDSEEALIKKILEMAISMIAAVSAALADSIEKK